MRSTQVQRLIHRREQHQLRRKNSLSQRMGRLGLGLAAGLSLLLVLALILGGMLYSNLTANLPSLDTLPALLNHQTGSLLQPTRLYDRSGNTLLLSLENPGTPRKFLTVDPDQPDSFSPQLTRALVALLEPDFWRSSGADLKNLTDPRPHTLAERLVDDLLLEKEAPSTIRALRMRLLAAQLIARFGRTRVLEWTLNSAYFGHLAYGAESAAQVYLGKSANDLNLAETAVLIAALQAPALNPLDAPQAVREQAQADLKQMLGRSIISQAEYAQANLAGVKFHAAPVISAAVAPAFTHLAVQQLAARLGLRQVERGGLRILTTLDVDLQTQTVCTLRTQLARLQNSPDPLDSSTCPASRLLPTLPPGLPAQPADLKGSALILDAASGEVLALAGQTTPVAESALAGENAPGSLLSPFIAVAGFARGMAPASLVWDIPASLPADLSAYQQPITTYQGAQRLRLAIANDYLAPLAQLLEQIGAQTVWRLSEPLGLTDLSSSAAPAQLLFNGGGISMLQAAQAYGVFANLGIQTGQAPTGSSSLQPTLVLSAQSADGHLLLDQRQPQTRAVLSPNLAYLVHHVLADETSRWKSLGYPNALEIGRPAGAKIGKTADGANFWVAGYTPQRVIVTWLGTSSNPAITLSPRYTAGVWHALMQYALRGLPVIGWQIPAGISSLDVCDPSGALPSADCPLVVNEVFLDGSQPGSYDTLYRVFQINRETHRLATIFTPLEMVEQHTYLVIPPEAQSWAKQTGVELPPTDYDAILAPATSPTANITAPALFSYVHGTVILRGTAAGVNFASYSVQVGQGLNPRTWQQVGMDSTQPIQNGTLAEWNTHTLEGLYALRLQVVRTDQHVESAVIQVTVDNTPPTLSSVSPVEGTHLTSNQPDVILSAAASDAIGIQRVEWWLDGSKLSEATAAPFSTAWKATPGRHSLVLKAYDLAGNETITPPIAFIVGD